MKRQKLFRRKEAGFTLVEVVTGMLVLAIGLLSVATMQAYYLKETYVAQETFAADGLASQVLEIIMNDPTQVSSISRRDIRSCTGTGWTGQVCSALREALLRDGKEGRLQDAEVELSSTGSVWTVSISWKVGDGSRHVSSSIRL
jgi:prepilin-type N-terminal cleavage/methylation domain-containing protein